MQPQVTVNNGMTRIRVAKQFALPSLAKQSFKQECDINTLMRKYEKSGVIEHLNTYQGKYGNFIGFQDYQTSLNQILEAEESFATIPAKIRSRFQNNPATFLEFAQNPDNLSEMIEMGLAPAKASEPPGGDAGHTGGKTHKDDSLPLEHAPAPDKPQKGTDKTGGSVE